PDIYIEPATKPMFDAPAMFWGNKPVDGGYLLMSPEEARTIVHASPEAAPYLRQYYGSQEFIDGKPRVCVWVDDDEQEAARAVVQLSERVDAVRDFRLASKAKETRPASKFPHRVRQMQGSAGNQSIIVPIHTSTSEKRGVGLRC